MKKYVISENILSATLQYLETRPFAEVARLHSAINTDIKEFEEYKVEEITKKKKQREKMKS